MQVQVAVPVRWYTNRVPEATAGLAFYVSPERSIGVKLHGAAMCIERRFGTHPKVSVRVETSRATYGYWTGELPPPPAGASAHERHAFAAYHVARFTPAADAATRARREACLETWYAAVEAMTATPLADLLVHGDVVVRLSEVFTADVYANGDFAFRHTHARGMRDGKAASTKVADVTAAIAAAMGYGGVGELLAAHRIVGVEGGDDTDIVKRKRPREGRDATLAYRKLTVAPVNVCAAPECAASVGSVTGMALCGACKLRLGGAFHTQTRSFRAGRAGRLKEVRGSDHRPPTLPMFVHPPGPYHLPDDVAAHVLYVARLCKERLATTPVRGVSAFVRGVLETPACALDAARFRPGLEALYARLRMRRELIAAYERAADGGQRAALEELCDRFRAGHVAPAEMTRAVAALG